MIYIALFLFALLLLAVLLTAGIMRNDNFVVDVKSTIKDKAQKYIEYAKRFKK